MRLAFLSRRARTVGAVGLATLMLSTLAYADPKDVPPGLEKKDVPGVPPGQAKKVDPPVVDALPPGQAKKVDTPVVPEANAGWVLIPVVAAVLFFSTRRLWPAKAEGDTEGQKGSG